MSPLSLDIPLSGGASISAVLLRPARAWACYVFAHGAGADMNHPFVQTISEKLAAARIATLRYQFPFMQRRSQRPDRPVICHAAVRAAVGAAATRLPKLPLIAGGKSFGGRMTSQAQALEPLPHVIGLAFFGFPWHSPKLPSLQRSEHLQSIRVPMLFMQGERDTLGDSKLIRAQIPGRLKNSVLMSVPHADHGFHVPVRSGRTDAQVQDELVDAFSGWGASLIKPASQARGARAR